MADSTRRILLLIGIALVLISLVALAYGILPNTQQRAQYQTTPISATLSP
jgi:hypothetical protein